ncbi:fructosamine kinase [Brachybacterium endophyticum]|uniref:Fructosamine kinase n=1 Tax=Brachybacterium endophyticum TaxID=2182385 RepID=A0A2U2RJP0_9MICO|nr:fructosamine kinase family protein [Brachybacterium endophyticum]PWH06066.1 fructosamine kinase [Brachybacterium endophyticum]
MADHLKQRPGAPQGFFATEAAGLTWLAEPRAVPVVEVLEVGEDFLRLERLEPARPSAADARTFGERMARLHDAGAEGFGASPSDTSWFGPLEDPFEVPTTVHEDFATFWAEDRLRPLADHAARRLGSDGSEAVGRAIDAIAGGAFDGISGQGREQASRVHGDLWSGNLMWTDQGGTLIDPSAHGGHRLEDLALLTLFGAPHLDEILAGYEHAHPMPSGWREDLPAHLFFALLAHVVLFGGGYAAEAIGVAGDITRRARELGG